MRGIGDIPSLRLEVLQGLITSWMSPPELILSNYFDSRRSPSAFIKWESRKGNRGLAPFVPPGSPAPKIGMPGVAEHEAYAAYIKEKKHFDEEFLNNLRRPGTNEEHWSAQQILAEAMADLENRNRRRKEWMIAQMLFGGSFNYYTKGGVQVSVDYDIPSDQVVTLADAYKWDSGQSRDILGDINDARKTINDANGAMVTHMFLNSTTLEYLAEDDLIRTILQKSAFGDGSLFNSDRMGALIGANAGVIGNVLNIPNFVVYDEKYQIRATITSGVSSGDTTVTVDDSADFAAGETLRFWDVSTGNYEDATISSIDVNSNTITLSSAVSSSYKAREDYVSMTKPFVPDDKVVLMAAQVDGRPIAAWYDAPFGLERHYGMYADRKEQWDPEGVEVRVQSKGLPVLFQKDALYILTVA